MTAKERIAATLKEMFWNRDEIPGTEINAALAHLEGAVATKNAAKRLAGLDIVRQAGPITMWGWVDRAADEVF